MTIAQSKITAQGQISVPAEVRRKLGLCPGNTISWEERDDAIIVKRVGEHSFASVHQALFGLTLPTKTKLNVKDGIKKHMLQKHKK